MVERNHADFGRSTGSMIRDEGQFELMQIKLQVHDDSVERSLTTTPEDQSGQFVKRRR